MQKKFSVKSEIHFSSSLVLFSTITVFLLPVLVDFLIYGWQRVFSYFAADTFYYLMVGKNFGDFGLFSFDQTYITNGFHPLWQVLVGWLYRIFLSIRLPDPTILVLIFAFSIGLIALAILLWGKAIFEHIGRRVPIYYLFLPVGVYPVLMALIHARYGTLWSYSNAMETSPLLLAYALLAWIATRDGFLGTFRSAVLTGLAFSIIILSRLPYISGRRIPPGDISQRIAQAKMGCDFEGWTGRVSCVGCSNQLSANQSAVSRNLASD
jgi:hypothetical protein